MELFLSYLWWRKRLFGQRYGSSDHFPNGTGCTPRFFRMSAGTKLNCTFNYSSRNEITKQKVIKAFLRATVTNKEFLQF